jgi:prepilin-type N-terminal cleavage/methylation domain-containing protein
MIKLQRNKNEAGFTLVELIIAMTILAGTIIFVLILAPQMTALTHRMQARDDSISLAKSKIEELRSGSTSTLTVGTTTNTPQANYTRTTTISHDSGTPTSLFRVLVTVTNASTGSTGAVSLETYIYVGGN